MPPKRSAIGRLTNQAKRKREERASETSEQRQERQERNRVHTSLVRKFLTDGKKYNSGHDESGVSNNSEKDICDCLTEECPGCHFPCPKCRSCKCGADCRVNRKWTYDIIENEVEVGNTKTEPTTDCCIFHS